MNKIKIFLSSVEVDEPFRKEIKKRLKILGRREQIELVHEREIPAGEDWQKTVEDQLNQAAIILLLISPDYLASDFHYQEVLCAAEQKISSGCKVVPIHIRPVNWVDLPIAELRPVPSSEPVSSWQNRDEAYLKVEEEIQAVVDNYVFQVGGTTEVKHKKHRDDVMCPMCGMNVVDQEEAISLESFEALETGWAIGGKVQLHYNGHHVCHTCGNVFDFVKMAVPIQLPDSMFCPICEKKVAMKFAVKKVEKVADDCFTFYAIWDCKYCNYFKPLAKSLKFVRDLLGIKVSPDAIEVQTG